MKNVFAASACLVRWSVADNPFIAMRNRFWRIGCAGQRHDFTLNSAGDWRLASRPAARGAVIDPEPPGKHGLPTVCTAVEGEA